MATEILPAISALAVVLFLFLNSTGSFLWNRMRGRMCTVDAKYGLLAKVVWIYWKYGLLANYEFIAKYRFISKVWIYFKVWIYLYGHRNTIQTTLPSGKKG